MSARATLTCGLLLGLAICLLETMDQPVAQTDAGNVWAFLGSVSPVWCATGVGWAFVARAAEERLSGFALVGASLITAAGFSLLQILFDRTVPVNAKFGVLALDARAAHVAWTNAFYGGLYVTAFVSSRRVVRSRWMLARVRQAREDSAALLEASRLDAYRHQLQPDTILTALDVLRRQYREAPDRADILLDVLVGFLRSAVRGLSGEASTLARELELARRYLLLRSMTTSEADAAVAPTPARPAPETPFPPRLLMPVLERLCLAGCRVDLRGAWRGDAYAVTIIAERAGETVLPPALKRRMTMNLDHARPDTRGVVRVEADRLVWSFENHRAPVGEPSFS